MALYELTPAGSILSVPSTTFAEQRILEREDLQRALRSDISMLAPDLLVVAEEFGDFRDVRRRIDLLCVDKSGQLVVVELKRTEDGGHMELQALRYAAMVSTMTFRQLVDIFERHLQRLGDDEGKTARERLAEFLDDVGGEDAVIERRVRIVLVSAGFDTRITTTVLWLNDLYGLDIMCVRLTPYRVEGRLVLDVQQVIPLPEAAELTVKIRERETAVRASLTAGSGADWTPFVIEHPGGVTEPLRKRRAVLVLITALHGAGVGCAAIERVLPGSRMLSVDGEVEGDDLVEALVATHPGTAERLPRWFLEDPLHEDGRTWVVSKSWGTNTVPTLDALLELAPSAGFGYRAEP